MTVQLHRRRCQGQAGVLLVYNSQVLGHYAVETVGSSTSLFFMVSITPLNADEAEGHAREFFRPDFREFRLGTYGIWSGSGAAMLGLSTPVAAEEFNNLLRGRSPDARQDLLVESNRYDRVAVWKMTFSASQRALGDVTPGGPLKQVVCAPWSIH